MVLWLAAALAVGACWAFSGWQLWSVARGREPRTGALWKLLATAFLLALCAAARTVSDEMRADAGAVWTSEGLVHLARLLLALIVPFAIAVVSRRRRA